MDRLVALAVSRRYLMVGMFVAVLIGGLIAFKQLNIEAYPDPTPPMVDIVTQSPGLSAEAHYLAVRTVRRQTAVLLRLHL
jgi:heavy metal efflux system protein